MATNETIETGATAVCLTCDDSGACGCRDGEHMADRATVRPMRGPLPAYDAAVARGRARWGERYQEPAGAFADVGRGHGLAYWLNAGARLEVDVYGDGTYIKRGRVGLSGGWAPTFLLMLTARSQGSSILLDGRSRVLQVIRG